MAGEIPDLVATARTGTGKGAARQARRDNQVPGIVYGGGVDPLPINIPFNVLLKRLKEGRFLSTLFNMQVEGQDDVRVICRGVQRDVVKDLPTHVDFMRLRRNSRVNLFIPVEFVNEDIAPGLKMGGVLNVVRYAIEVVCRADSIPEKLVCDLTGTELGDSIHISAIELPEGVRPAITDRDFTVASIAAPSAVKAEAAEEAEEGEEGEEIEGEEGEGEEGEAEGGEE